MRHLLIPFIAAAGLVLGLGGSAMAQSQQAPAGSETAPDGTVMARLVDKDGADVGKATFKPMRAGVLVEVEVAGLPPGPHGIHIHETGACTPDFDAAGAHLAPDGHEHGFAKTDAPHSGDLPNLLVQDDGRATAEFMNWRLSPDDLLDSDGSAIVIHAQEDDFTEMQSAGERLACGVVEQQS